MKVKGKYFSQIIFSVNLFFIICVAAIFIIYTTNAKKRIYDENISNIVNINRAASRDAYSSFQSQSNKVGDIYQYLNNSTLSLEEATQYIYDSTSVNNNHKYALIDTQGVGKIAASTLVDVSYTEFDYNHLKEIFENAKAGDLFIGIAPEFTDKVTGSLLFALYTYIKLGDEKIYTLLSMSTSSTASKVFGENLSYKQLSSTLLDLEGNYIISNNDFKGDNFFDFIYKYNDLSLTEKNKLKSSILESKNGKVEYLNGRGEKSIFAYSLTEDEKMICITLVPISSLHYAEISLFYISIVAVILLLLLLFDVIIFTFTNKRLEQGMKREVEANNAKTEFLSRVSHDIRTPLNGITGSTHLALEEKDPNVVREYLELINSNGEFLLGLINDILDMSKVESGKMELNYEPYSYNSFKRSICAVIEPLCKNKNINFIINDPKDLNVYVEVDIIHFNQIFLNLISNAVKYTPKNGTVEFSIQNEKIDDKTISAYFIVKDSGIGMSEEFQSHLFEPFSQEGRLKQNIEGTGLGLPIVLSIVKQMNGEINFESTLDKGTTFYVSLDLKCVEREKVKQKEEKEKDLSVLVGKKVLMCEDNAVNVVIAKKELLWMLLMMV